MSNSALTCNQKMSAARIIIRDRFPYFRAALFGAVYREVEPGSLNTMAMTDRGVLMWDKQDVDRLTVDECAAAIMHELMHWLRDHHKRCKALGAHARFWNFAADAEINDDVRDMKLKLPANCIFAAHFTGLDGQPMKDGNIAEVYYAAIRQTAQQLSQPGNQGKGKGAGQGCDEDGDGSGDIPSPGRGWCGSVAGRPHPKEPKGGRSGDADIGDKDANGQEGEGHGDDGRTEADAVRIRKSVAEAAVKHAATKGRGTVPGGFLAWAEAEIAPPKIDWRTKLNKSIKSSIAYRPGAVTTTWSGFGRKQAALGFGPGRPLTPKWRAPVPRVTMVIDTSGSMGSGENSPLAQAASETAGVLSATNAAVTIVACDASVHAVKECRTWQEAVKEFKGGGGTDMRPAFQAVMSTKGGKQPPEIVICVTDGYIGDPGQPLPGVRMIWVIVGGKTKCAEWGETIVVDDLPDPKAKAA